MSTLFASFNPTSKQEWVELLQKELKGESIDVLQKFNRIEEIILPAYLHREDAPTPFSDPGMKPFTRGNNAESNDWHIGTCFRVSSDEKTVNAEILQALMSGTTALVVHAVSDKPIDFTVLLKDVGLEYIHTTFCAATTDQAVAFLDALGSAPGAVVVENNNKWLTHAASCSNNCRPFAVQAMKVQRSGGTTWQEIAIALAEGHDLLVAQLEAGLSVDEACANIHFVFGIGSKYFYEIAKFRAFRTAWARIVEIYEPVAPNAMKAFVTAETGFMHTALKDPYTNLLRQTTEAMSAVVGGADQLVVQPYDWHSTQPETPFTRRMATNVSLLLKEEAYLHVVADPAGGSYLLDELTHTIAERAWELFREIEAKGGISVPESISMMEQAISEKAEQRMQLIKDKKALLIGITTFPNPETVTAEWDSFPEGWKSLPALIVESVFQPV